MEEIDIAVIGGGPAGLRAAEVAAAAGRKVVVFDGKRSVGRKFLVAGKGGLNLTHGEELEKFVGRYRGGELWENLLNNFSPTKLRQWCEELGNETFQASSGRVYPTALKGAPVLRSWLQRLRELGVEIRPNCQWTGCGEGGVQYFSEGESIRARAVVFGLGGASWPKTGSDGGWVEIFRKMGISVHDLEASNCGWEIDWSEEILEKAEGLPMKNIRVRVSGDWKNGELMLTRYGLEGGIIYALGRELREAVEKVLAVDFKPTFTEEELVGKAGTEGGKFNFDDVADRWKLGRAAREIVRERNFANAAEMAVAIKNFKLRLKGPRPIAEAISSDGGVCWSELDGQLMLRNFPGMFVCGEMIDWDVPTGGYLLQGAFATGTCAGKGAAEFGI